jgi:hypothetical protein
MSSSNIYPIIIGNSEEFKIIFDEDQSKLLLFYQNIIHDGRGTEGEPKGNRRGTEGNHMEVIWKSYGSHMEVTYIDQAVNNASQNLQ